MITLSEIFEREQYKIVDSGQFLWQSFGQDAWYVDFDSGTSVVYDTKTKVIYLVDQISGEKFFRYIHQDYFDIFTEECSFRKTEPLNIFAEVFATRIYNIE